MTDSTLPQSLLSLLNSVGSALHDDVSQALADNQGNDLDLGHLLTTVASDLANQFVYTPIATVQNNSAGVDAGSPGATHQDPGQALHHAFDDWVDLLAPWAQSGAANFVSNAVDALHEVGMAIATDLHNIKNPHSS